jgi:hypothetical protein
VIHAINFAVYEINRGCVNANLLNLKENMAVLFCMVLAGRRVWIVIEHSDRAGWARAGSSLRLSAIAASLDRWG